MEKYNIFCYNKYAVSLTKKCQYFKNKVNFLIVLSHNKIKLLYASVNMLKEKRPFLLSNLDMKLKCCGFYVLPKTSDYNEKYLDNLVILC